MMITAHMVADALEPAIGRLACVLPADVRAGLEAARQTETDPRGAVALGMLCENARLAAAEGLPLCQDTGTVRVTLEVGPDVGVAGDVFSLVDEVVAREYTRLGLRASVVKDALTDRANTKDNTPAFCRLTCVDEPGAARLRVMLKGGGSDNACRVVMLPPSAGRAGVVAEVLRAVQEKAANACPPLVVGVGVGSTFDHVADLATRALFREVGSPAPTPEAAELEAELAAAIRATGIGAGAQGGAATALAVHVLTAPSHIAALPLAIELGCCALRRCTIDLREVAPAPEPAAESPADRAAQLQQPQSAQLAPNWAKRLSLPLSREDVAALRAGDACTLTGELFTLRDAGHARLCAELDARGSDRPLPYGLDGAVIFYAGPTPASPNHPERPFGAVGPTTASRMDAFAPRLFAAGVAGAIGKGSRSSEVARACAESGCACFSAIGGAAALLGSCVTAAETIAYEDLGTEALRRIAVRDLPVTVAIDSRGTVFSPNAAAPMAGGSGQPTTSTPAEGER